jgi:hypothetical protein
MFDFVKPSGAGRRGLRRRRQTWGRSPHWVKVKNPNAPAVKREAEEDYARTAKPSALLKTGGFAFVPDQHR